jgi:hypothetical protein
MRDIGVPSGRGILAGTAPSLYHIPNFSPRLPHPSDLLRVERLSKEREAKMVVGSIEVRRKARGPAIHLRFPRSSGRARSRHNDGLVRR